MSRYISAMSFQIFFVSLLHLLQINLLHFQTIPHMLVH